MAFNIQMGGNIFKTLKEPEPSFSDVTDVTWRKTPGGKEIAVKYSEPLRRRGYRIWLECATSPDDYSTWRAFVNTLNGYSETFTFIDHRGDSFTARFLSNPEPVFDEEFDVLIDIEVIEVRA